MFFFISEKYFAIHLTTCRGGRILACFMLKVILENDELKIDGNLAVCWSSNLEFTVERSTKTLVGSAVSGEGLVNVYRGTGRVLMCPVAPTTSLFESTNTMAAKAAAKSSNTFGK